MRKGSDDSLLRNQTGTPLRGPLGIAEGRRQSGGSIGTRGSSIGAGSGRVRIDSPTSQHSAGGNLSHGGAGVGHLTPLSPSSADGYAPARRLGSAAGFHAALDEGLGHRSSSGSAESSPMSSPGGSGSGSPSPVVQSRRHPGASAPPSRLRQVVPVSPEEQQAGSGKRSPRDQKLAGQDPGGDRGRSSRRRLHDKLRNSRPYQATEQSEPQHARSQPVGPHGIAHQQGRVRRVLSGGEKAREAAMAKTMAGRNDAEDQVGYRRSMGHLPVVPSVGSLVEMGGRADCGTLS